MNKFNQFSIIKIDGGTVTGGLVWTNVSGIATYEGDVVIRL